MSRHHGRHLAQNPKTIAGSATLAASAAIGMTVSSAVAASAAGEEAVAAPAPAQITQPAKAPAAPETFSVPATDAEFSIASIEVDVEEAPEAPAPAPVEVAQEVEQAAPAPQAASAPQAAPEPAPAPAVVAPAANSSVVGIARAYAGSPYAYGGTTPAGFDCSGFTSFVYSQVGVSLPRSSGAQGSVGVRVPASQAQPGDLVYWPGHVGIYTGNGMHIAARNPAAGVAEGPVYGSPAYIRVR